MKFCTRSFDISDANPVLFQNPIPLLVAVLNVSLILIAKVVMFAKTKNVFLDPILVILALVVLEPFVQLDPMETPFAGQ